MEDSFCPDVSDTETSFILLKKLSKYHILSPKSRRGITMLIWKFYVMLAQHMNAKY